MTRRRRRTRRRAQARTEWLVRLVRGIRRALVPGRHATGDRSLARRGPVTQPRGRFRRGLWCDACDRPVDVLHPTCSYCPQCCGCPPEPPADSTGATPAKEGTP